MNSFHNLTCYKEGYQMSVKGPDGYVINHHTVENPVRLKWKLKTNHSFMPIKRKDSREFLPRRLKNSQEITKVYIIIASNAVEKLCCTFKTKLFLIPYKIEASYVTFAPITHKQYILLKNKLNKMGVCL